MDSKVKVTSDDAGNVVIVSKNNPEWAHIRVEQNRIVVDDNGFARRKTISALVHGTVEDLKSFGWKKDQELPGKIIFKESLEPFNASDPERDYKIAGKTNIVCCQDGQPIYRKTFYTTNMSSEDISVAHNNGDAIKEAYAKNKEKVDEISIGISSKSNNPADL
jgi:hypothetical protein